MICSSKRCADIYAVFDAFHREGELDVDTDGDFSKIIDDVRGGSIMSRHWS